MSGSRNAAWRIAIAGIAVVVGGLAWGSGDARALALEKEVPSESPVPARSNPNSDEFGRLTALALQADAAVSEPAIQALRRHGPQSVEFLMSQPELRKSPRWSAVLDSVAQQKDAEFSGLYWHTDIEEALAVAKRDRHISPLDDPWYGLSRPDVYSAIKNDGRMDAVAQNPGH